MTLKVEHLDDELFRQVKAMAAMTGVTLRQYVTEALAVALTKSKQIEHGQVSRIAHSLGYVRGKAGNA